MTDVSAKLEIKQRLDRALKWLEKEPTKTATTAAKMFDVNAISIWSRQLPQRKQVRNTRGSANRHGGNNIILKRHKN